MCENYKGITETFKSNNDYVNLEVRNPDVNTSAGHILLFLLAFEETTRVLNVCQSSA
jgi:hypothetical protein